jgi:hypothetical protein
MEAGNVSTRHGNMIIDEGECPQYIIPVKEYRNI